MGETIANWQTFCEHAALSDVGLRRSNNQDSFAVALAGDESHWLARGHMFIVADGMGAHAAGELASKMACSSTPLTYQKLANRPAPDALHEAIVDANAHIHERGQGSSDFNGMGTTFSTLVLLPQGAIVGHVGDSRVYRVSVGIAHFPEHAANMEGLMQKADIAMYEAKQAGGSVFRFSGGAAPAAASAGGHAAAQRPDSKPTH